MSIDKQEECDREEFLLSDQSIEHSLCQDTDSSSSMSSDGLLALDQNQSVIDKVVKTESTSLVTNDHCHHNSYEQLLLAIESQASTVLFTFRGDLSSACNKQLIMINSFVDEFIDLGYKVLGVTMQSSERLKKLSERHVFKFDIYSLEDDRILSVLLAKYRFKVNMAKNKSLCHGIMLEPAFLVLNQQQVLYSWSYSPNYMSRSLNMRPKVVRIMDVIKGGSYQHDHPTPISGVETFFFCKSPMAIVTTPWPTSDSCTETSSTESDINRDANTTSGLLTNSFSGLFDFMDVFRVPSCSFNMFKFFTVPQCNTARLPHE